MLAGAGERSDWVRNLRADPSSSVRVRDATYAASGRVIADADEEVRARDLVFAKYQPRYGSDLTSWRASALAVALDVQACA
jgi:hypothetical protein